MHQGVEDCSGRSAVDPKNRRAVEPVPDVDVVEIHLRAHRSQHREWIRVELFEYVENVTGGAHHSVEDDVRFLEDVRGVFREEQRRLVDVDEEPKFAPIVYVVVIEDSRAVFGGFEVFCRSGAGGVGAVAVVVALVDFRNRAHHYDVFESEADGFGFVHEDMLVLRLVPEKETGLGYVKPCGVDVLIDTEPSQLIFQVLPGKNEIVIATIKKYRRTLSPASSKYTTPFYFRSTLLARKVIVVFL